MTTTVKFQETGKVFIATNGKKFPVYSKQTKSGLRFYRSVRGCMYQVSKNEIV
jgi:hypothetical protein